MKRPLSLLTLAGLVSVAACADVPVAPAADAEPALEAAAARWENPAVAQQAERAIRALGSRLAAQYAGTGAVPLRADWIAAPGGEAMGATYFFADVGNKQIGARYVPGDPRRQGRSDVRYAVTPSAPAGLTAGAVDAAIDRAMATWDAVTCSQGLSMSKVAPSDPTWDILHDGFVPLPQPILGVTFPFIWVDANGPTDIDNNGAFDYAFAVILYSTAYQWAIDGNIDVETVAAHEAGHGLGQAHFGALFATPANGQFHFAPRALMNAGYTGIQQSLSGTDEAGHCGLFGAWPNN